MANAPKSSGALVPQAAAGDTNTDLDTALNGVEGKVRKAIVTKLRALVDKDPAAFVRHMRSWMDQGRADE
ncbi:MAG: hypothetical protein WDO24_12805 [Pseudomonadota bacterium]